MSTQGPPADAKQAQAAALHEIEAAQRRKRALDMSLANLEATIYASEASYLDDTAASGGNIIKGFESYLKPPAHGYTKRKMEAGAEDRLFSGSSVQFQQQQ
ncbi:Chromatin modification-related protein EAF6 [Vanrija pseudolonga]|uniref:Chromatin modification-related protein EAF6 n=1 Tax=Vanrija pseudolonga TaxID=143232 RepID=A0AAF0YJ04_9TREE|nr:Chromatin modification-related protein EAF6 [Vanrija pseudolonga]